MGSNVPGKGLLVKGYAHLPFFNHEYTQLRKRELVVLRTPSKIGSLWLFR